MAKAGKHGVTTETPKNILFGAGTYHKNLKYTPGASGGAGSWNFDSVIGATSGGGKLSIIPEITPIEIDGAVVNAKGLTKKTGEKATIETNFIELTQDIIKATTLGTTGTSEDDTFDLIESKANIEEGDYLDNIGFVGETLDGRKIILILENALCTSGFENEGKNKEGVIGKYTFESYAELDSDLDKLPWKIYYPKASA